MPTVVSVDVIDLDHEEEVFDIQVDEDESFIVHDAVVHNSTTCKAYSRKVWLLPGYEPVGHKLPFNGGTPRHWHCRSITVPLAKAYADLPARFQARIALQQRQAVFNGAEPADLDYNQWLNTQSVARQKAALGPRYSMWKSGSLSLEDMIDQSGSPLSIRELRKMVGLS